jgi:hypothetical protein
MNITQALVKEYFEYRDGNLYRIKKTGKNTHIGEKAGSNLDKYNYVCFNRKYYGLHRLIFLYHYGFIPKFIDHIDRDPLNNRIENLRECTGAQNQGNRTINKNNKSGYKGVKKTPKHLETKNNIFSSRVIKDRKAYYCGVFKTAEDAARAYDHKAKELFGEFACLNFPTT